MFSILKIDGSLNGYQQDADGRYMEFVADTVADIAALPTGSEDNSNAVKPRPGSMAVCIANRSLYVLSNARKWAIFAEGQ